MKSHWLKRVIPRLLVTMFILVGLILPAFMSPVSVSATANWLGTWSHRIAFTIDQANVDATITNYPLKLTIDNSSGIGADNLTFIFDELGANYLKIAVTDSSGDTELYVEVANWDSDNKTAELYTKVPSISSSVDTTIYLYYDNSHADNTAFVALTGSKYVSGQVWDSNYYGVYHMYDYSTALFNRTGSFNGSDSIQGICTDGTYWYAISNTYIRKYDLTWDLVASNTNAGTQAGVNHLNGADYYDGHLYVSGFNSADSSNQRVAIFNSSDLSYDTYVDLTATAAPDVTGVAIDSANDTMYISNGVKGENYIWKYKFSDYSLLDTIEYEPPVNGWVQSMKLYDGHFYLVDYGTNAVYKYNLDGTYDSIVAIVGQEAEDVDFLGTDMYVLQYIPAGSIVHVYDSTSVSSHIIRDSSGWVRTGYKKSENEPSGVGGTQVFDGTDDILHLGHINGTYYFSAGITLEFYLSFPPLTSSPNAIITFFNPEVTDALSVYAINSSGAIQFKLTTTEGTSPRPTIYESNLTEADKYMAFTYDKDKAYGWADGVVRNTTERDNTALIFNDIFCLSDQAGGSYPFEGTIDEFRISNVARSAAYMKLNDYSFRDTAGTWENRGIIIPQNVAASTDNGTKVTITWDAVDNATDYAIYRDGEVLVASTGNVQTYDDETADPPTITGGTAAATDGSSETATTLTLTGATTNHGPSYSYTVTATDGEAISDNSTEATGYRHPGTLTLAWFRGTDDITFGTDLSGTTNPFDDTTGEAGTVYYYRATLSAAGAENVNSASDTGYKAEAESETPAIVTTASATSITDTTATSGGNITDTGSSNVTERGICYGTSINPNTGGPKISQTAGAPYSTGTYTCNMVALNPETTYHVRAYAINSTGTSYGPDQSFETLATPEPTPTPTSTPTTPGATDSYLGFGTILTIAPTVLLLSALFGSGFSLAWGIKTGKLQYYIFSALGLVLVVTLFINILTVIDNLRVGNW